MSSSALTDNVPPSDDVYEPRRSGRVNADLQADGDTWYEKLLVCESSAEKLVIRSYFRNSRTAKKVWDEPPSGASRVEPATPEMRRKAEEELQVLQAAVATNAAPGKKKSKAGGILPSFLKKSKDKNGGSSSSSGGTILFGGKKSKSKSKSVAKSSPDPVSSEDADIQKAISLSMGLSLGEDAVPADSSGNGNWQDDIEALEMAKAISMSEAESKTPVTTGLQSEDEMLQRVLEESRRQTSEVAAMPTQLDASDECNLLGLGLEQREPPEHIICKSESLGEMFLDQKMPAKPARTKPLGMTAEGGIPEQDTDTSGILGKMDVDDARRKPGIAISRRIFSKKSVEEEAGVV